MVPLRNMDRGEAEPPLPPYPVVLYRARPESDRRGDGPYKVDTGTMVRER